MMNNILIIKTDECIMISNNGKKLIINRENRLFDLLKNKNQDEIKEWYLHLREGGE